MRIEAFAIWSNGGQAKLAIAGSNLTGVDTARTAALEAEIARLQAALPPLHTFILPGGTPAAAALHLARAICRRAERHAVALAHADPAGVRPEVVRYLNRLSDLLFALARAANQEAGIPDAPWRPDPV